MLFDLVVVAMVLIFFLAFMGLILIGTLAIMCVVFGIELPDPVRPAEGDDDDDF